MSEPEPESIEENEYFQAILLKARRFKKCIKLYACAYMILKRIKMASLQP